VILILAKLSCFYPVAELKSIASVDENSLNYFQVRKLVKNSAYGRVSAAYRGMKRIVLVALSCHGYRLNYASAKLRADIAFLMKGKHPCILHCLSKEIRERVRALYHESAGPRL